MLPSKRGLCLPKLVSVPKRQPGVQMDLTSSELPNAIQKIIREDFVKKIVYHAKLIMSQPIMLLKYMTMKRTLLTLTLVILDTRIFTA